MHNRLLPGALALLALEPCGALADDSSRVRGKLEEIVVTSSRVPTPLREIGTSMSVVNRTDIQQLGYNALYDILRTQPGVGVSSQSGPGSVTSLRIRGEENYRTRFYLDGIDISDSSSPQTTTRVEQILASGVQRVEILRGPQGLMYGADAGGVVNITTTAPGEGLGGSLSGEAGRFDTRQYAGNLNGGNGTVDFSLSASDYDSDLFNAWENDDAPGDEDGYENQTLHGRLGWNAGDELRIALAARDVDAKNRYDDCFTVDTFAPSNDCSDSFDQRAWRGAVNLATGPLTHELHYTDTSTGRDFFTEQKFAFKLDGDIERAGYIGSFRSSDAMQLVYGVDLLTESIDDGFNESDREQQGYFAEYQGDYGERVFVTAGLRYDDNDDFGSHTSYRVSGAYLLAAAFGELKLRAAYATGFRPPSLFEIAQNASEFTAPPAQGLALSEEQSEGYDLGVSWSNGSSVYLEAVYFDQQISDEIFYDFNSFGYLQESGDTRSTGVELSGDWDIYSAMTLRANYTFTDSEDISGDPRARRPKHMGNLGVSWSLLAERLTLGLQARFSRDAVDVDGTDLDNYEVVDINARLALVDDIELYGRIENVTDEDYQEVPAYNTSGAAGYLGVRYSF